MDKTFFKIIMGVWGGIIVLNILTPKNSFSPLENRFLAKLPAFSIEALVDGSFMQKMDDWINDHFVARDIWVAVKSDMEKGIGKKDNNGVFFGEDRLIEDIKQPDMEIVDANIQGIKKFVQSNKIPSYLMLVPSTSGVLTHKIPRYAPTWNQEEFISEVNKRLEGIVTPIPIYNTLYENRDKNIYYRTDHHWTTDGAYLGYKEVEKIMDLKPKDISEFKIEEKSNSFYGTLYSKAAYTHITPDVIKTYNLGEIEKFTVIGSEGEKEYASMYFDKYLNEKDKYSYFLGSNEALVKIKTKSTTGKKLLMFKDSYSHCFAPFLTEDYSEITLVDLRYINMNIDDLVNIEEYNQVLFLYSIDVFSHQKNPSKLKFF